MGKGYKFFVAKETEELGGPGIENKFWEMVVDQNARPWVPFVDNEVPWYQWFFLIPSYVWAFGFRRWIRGESRRDLVNGMGTDRHGSGPYNAPAF